MLTASSVNSTVISCRVRGFFSRDIDVVATQDFSNGDIHRIQRVGLTDIGLDKALGFGRQSFF